MSKSKEKMNKEQKKFNTIAPNERGLYYHHAGFAFVSKNHQEDKAPELEGFYKYPYAELFYRHGLEYVEKQLANLGNDNVKKMDYLETVLCDVINTENKIEAVIREADFTKSLYEDEYRLRTHLTKVRIDIGKMIDVLKDSTPSVVAPSQIEETEKIEALTKRSEEIKNAFAEYGFIEYLKTSKGYNESQIIKIESLISENETPFIIALLEEIEYLDYFKKEYCNSKGTERDEKLGAVLKAAPRRIKGNINVLNAKSTESRTDYTSRNFKENVSEIIKGL
jgi:hypothetical protein